MDSNEFHSFYLQRDMKNIKLHLVFFTLVILISCTEPPTIVGLWVVESVKMGDEEMTPNARWMRFNSDSTQESGNGWFQHSVGKWTYNLERSELDITNTNGLADPFGPFNIKISNHQMTWKRLEEGQPVEVRLVKKEVLPKTYGDHILGLWELDDSLKSNIQFLGLLDEIDYLFFRWDRKFVIGTKKGKRYGVYNVHGHKAELELFPYGKELERSRWAINQSENKLTLSMMNADSLIRYSFKRIDRFPE